jgi:hypothetical protein
MTALYLKHRSMRNFAPQVLPACFKASHGRKRRGECTEYQLWLLRTLAILLFRADQQSRLKHGSWALSMPFLLKYVLLKNLMCIATHLECTHNAPFLLTFLHLLIVNIQRTSTLMLVVTNYCSRDACSCHRGTTATAHCNLYERLPLI